MPIDTRNAKKSEKGDDQHGGHKIDARHFFHLKKMQNQTFSEQPHGHHKLQGRLNSH